MKMQPLRLLGAKLPFREGRRIYAEDLGKLSLRQAAGVPGTDKLPSNEFFCLARIVPEKFDYQWECPKVRTGTVFLPVGDGVGANADQLGHVLLEQASL